MSGEAPSGLVIYTRRDCSLCERMEREVRRIAGPDRPVRMVAIDDQPALLELYGHDVPVLCMDGEFVCKHFLDAARLRAALGAA